MHENQVLSVPNRYEMPSNSPLGVLTGGVAVVLGVGVVTFF